jgi:hypothetical protein
MDFLYTNFNFVPENIVTFIGLFTLVLVMFVIPGLIRIIIKLIYNLEKKMDMILNEILNRENIKTRKSDHKRKDEDE